MLLGLASFEATKKKTTSQEETAEAEPAPAQPTLVSEVQEITRCPAGLTLLLPWILDVRLRARQVKEELGKFQGEVCGQLQDTALCIRQAVARLCCVLAETAAKPQRRL